MCWGVGPAGAPLGSAIQTWPSAQAFSTGLQRYALRGLLLLLLLLLLLSHFSRVQPCARLHQTVHLVFSF